MIKRYDLENGMDMTSMTEWNNGKWVKHSDHIKEVERLKGVLIRVHDDLIQRADLKGKKHVDISDSVWIALCDILIGEPPGDV